MPDVVCYDASHDIAQRLAANDPAIAGLRVRVGSMENDFDNLAEKLGRAISKSSHLRVLDIDGYGFPVKRRAFSIKWASFFNWLTNNRSVELLRFSDVDFDLSISKKIDIFQILAPFFEHNRNLRCIELRQSMLHKSAPSLISALSQVEVSRLKRIDLISNDVGDENMANMINALNAMNGLCNLLDFELMNAGVQRKGHLALSALLKNPECRISYLGLGFNRFDSDLMGILVSGLAKCSCLKTLELRSSETRDVTQAARQILFMYLSSPMCSLNKIKLIGDFGDDDAASLGASLAANQNLKSLYMQYDDITASGYWAFSKCLKAPSSGLVELNLSGSLRVESDEAVVSIFEALVHNTTLKKLVLVNNPGITATGWATCFQVLVGSQCAIEELGLGYNNIDDEGASMLVNLVSNHMSTVRIVDIEGNESITSSGWREFANVLLPTSKSKLTTLRIGDTYYFEDYRAEPIVIPNDVIVDLLTALPQNNSLTELRIGHVDISPSSLGAATNILFDKTSVGSVCNSNHTLNVFEFIPIGDTECQNQLLISLLELNKLNDKAVVVRNKLLLSGVLGEPFVGHVFGSMSAAAFPSLIEWIGRDRIGYSVMHCLIRNFFPSLFEDRARLDACDSLTPGGVHDFSIANVNSMVDRH
jgi:hypothetical protein